MARGSTAMLMDSSRTEDPGPRGTHLHARTPAHAFLDFTYSCQAGRRLTSKMLPGLKQEPHITRKLVLCAGRAPQ
jgi:hypothetical protein